MFVWWNVVLPVESNGYLQVFLEGGLNQQRMGVRYPDLLPFYREKLVKFVW
jgi:hypothetical protein